MEQHRNILIVDDDERVLLILSRALVALGDSLTIETGLGDREALEKAKQTPYDLLITDLLMPGRNGVALTEAVQDLYPEILVIWITAHGCYRFREDSTRLGVSLCLEKPLRISEIRQAVLDVLEGKPRSS